MPADSLAAAFPVLERTAYLNAGTCGPVPTASVDAMAAVMSAGAHEGRGLAYYESLEQTAAQGAGDQAFDDVGAGRVSDTVLADFAGW